LHDKIMEQDTVIPTTVRNHRERNGAAMAAEIKAKAEKAPYGRQFCAWPAD
jgi:hypothetical protein